MATSTSTQDDPIGAKFEVKSLFNHDPQSRHALWSEFENSTDEEQRVKNLGKDFAVVHRFSKVEKDDDEYAWVPHSIEARSPLLRKTLDRIFSDYPSWYPDAKPYTISPPFNPTPTGGTEFWHLFGTKPPPPRRNCSFYVENSRSLLSSTWRRWRRSSARAL